MACDVSLLSGIAYFELLDEEERKGLASTIDLITLAQGEPLFQAGDPGDSLFVVRAGEVELYVRDTVGQKIVLTVAKEGALFGELALLEAKPRTATAVALTECHLLVLERDDLLLLFRKKPEAALHLLGAMGAMTRRADELLRTRVSRNVNVEVEEHTGGFYRIARNIARFGGSLPFLALNAAFFTSWFALNAWHPGFAAFDPFPYDFLKILVALEALFLSLFVLITQKQQADKDRVRADIEYQINIQAELKVAHLHEKVDRVYESMLERFVRLEKMLVR